MSGSATAASNGYRSDVEGLRAVAVLIVVAYHAAPALFRGGFVGVDVFFVLSGYLITGLLVREHATSGRIGVLDFYARRARRLLPASVVMLLVTTVVFAVIASPLEQALFARTALATSIYLSNVWFIRNTGDYFAPASEENPFLHTWSLAVEEQFYLVWPLLLVLVLGSRRVRPHLGAVLAGVTVVSFVASLLYMERDAVSAFFSAPLRAWEFSAGGLAALVPAVRLSRAARYAPFIGWLSLAGIVGTAVALTRATPFPGVPALLPVVATIGLLLAGASAPGRGAGPLLSSRLPVFLGRLSYSWYLWHWPAIIAARELWPQVGMLGRA